MRIITIPEKELETISALIIQACDSANKCTCLSCKGLIVLGKRIMDAHYTKMAQHIFSNVKRES